MFDIGFSEILVISAIALVVMGPERLPQALKTIALWIGRMKRLLRSLRNDLENEIGIDDVRMQLHNETIMRDLKNAKDNLESTVNDELALDNESSGNRITDKNSETEDNSTHDGHVDQDAEQDFKYAPPADVPNVPPESSDEDKNQK